MPFTPFHFGVGAWLKGLVPERISLSAFVVSQVVIDCETAYYLIRHDWPVHRWCHTFVLGVPVGLMAGGAVWIAWRGLRPFWHTWRVHPARSETSLGPSLVGGLLGGATHPLLDGIMHWDVVPFRPFLQSNPLLHSVGVVELHAICVSLGVAGLALLGLRKRLSSLYSRNRQNDSP